MSERDLAGLLEELDHIGNDIIMIGTNTPEDQIHLAVEDAIRRLIDVKEGLES